MTFLGCKNQDIYLPFLRVISGIQRSESKVFGFHQALFIWDHNRGKRNPTWRRTHLTPILCIQGGNGLFRVNDADVGSCKYTSFICGHYVVVLLLQASNLGLKEMLQPIESWVISGAALLYHIIESYHHLSLLYMIKQPLKHVTAMYMP